MQHSVSVDWLNVEIFSITPVDCGVVYSVLPSRWEDYECSYLLSVLTLLVFTYLNSLYLRGDFKLVRQIITLAIYRSAILAAVQVLLYADRGAAPDYFVGFLRFDLTRRGREGRAESCFGYRLLHSTSCAILSSSRLSSRCKWIQLLCS